MCSRHGRERRKALDEKPVRPARSIQPQPVKPARQASRKLKASDNETFPSKTAKEESVEHSANKPAAFVSMTNFSKLRINAGHTNAVSVEQFWDKEDCVLKFFRSGGRFRKAPFS